MTQEDYRHPIEPPPELVQQWEADWHCSGNTNGNGFTYFVATRAAQWGSDQELEACCEWLQDPDLNVDTYKLRAARRPEPKPPSLKELALEAMGRFNANAHTRADQMAQDFDTIRRALEQLPDNE
jgi:hypothetical protein